MDSDRLAHILSRLERGTDGIYVLPFSGGSSFSQSEEVRLREAVAAREYPNPLAEVARHHSIPVMDCEVVRFLEGIPEGGIIVDVGGCWGWHWRNVATLRPDVAVIIVDFVKANLEHARLMLADLLDHQAFLVHGDGSCLPFPAEVFDGYWSVQTLQHIPDFACCVREARRTLKRGGVFANYSLNRAWLVEMIYRAVGRAYHVEGMVPGAFYLARASDQQAGIVEEAMGGTVASRYTEVLFQPPFGLWTGGADSLLGRLDACLSGSAFFLRWVARQRSFHARRM